LYLPDGTIYVNSPTYKWKSVSGAVTYRLVVYYFDGSSYVITENLKASTYCSGWTCSYKPSTKLSGGDHRFFVRARNAVGWGPMSSWKAFTYSTPVAPTLISPTGTIGTDSPTYQWNDVSGAFLFRLSVYSIDTSSYVITENVKASTYCSAGVCAYTPVTALSVGNYKFKVRGSNSAGWARQH
jgi:hypothetical protein